MLLEFLLQQFESGKADSSGLGYSSMNTLRSAISSVANIDGRPAGQHPLVRRFMKAVFQQRPALPRYQTTWDPDIVLRHLKSLGRNKNLTTIQLSRKLTMLLLLQSGQRCQTLHLFDIRNMTLTSSKVSFRIGDLLKTSRPGHHISELTLKAYAPDRRLCIVTTLNAYLERMRDIRGSNTQLFLTTRPPIKSATRDTIRRWTKDLLKAASIDLNIFKPHYTRAAASSKAAQTVPLYTIIKTVGWSNSSTFAKYYNKLVLQQSTISSAILG